MIYITLSLFFLALISLVFSRGIFSYLVTLVFLWLGSLILLVEYTSSSELSLICFSVLFIILGNAVSFFFEERGEDIVNIEEEQ